MVLGLAAKGQGTFAKHTVLDAAQTVQKPEELSFADAAALPVAGATAYDVTHQIELEPGQTMLILGAGGGVGLMAAQIGNVHKFTVIGVASAAKQELVESTGATFVASGEGAADRVRAIAPEGVDVLIDLVGGQALRDLAVVAKDPSVIISTADPTTVQQLGGVAVVRTREGLEKVTGVAQYGLVDPQVTGPVQSRSGCGGRRHGGGWAHCWQSDHRTMTQRPERHEQTPYSQQHGRLILWP